MATGVVFAATAPSGLAASDTYCIGDASGTSRGGLTLGWAGGALATKADRGGTSDVRLAGINYIANGGSTKTFQLDSVASGTYDFRLAAGDMGSSQIQNIVVKDGTTTLFSLTAVSTNSGFFCDAMGNTWGDTGWNSNNVARSITVSSGQLNVVIGGTGSAATTLAYLSLVSTGGSGTTINAAVGNAVAAGATAGIVNTGANTISARVGNAVADGATASISNTATGSITLDPLVNFSNTPLASETGITAVVLDAVSGAVIATKTNLTTDAAGQLSAIADPAISAGIAYRTVLILTGDRSNVEAKTAA